jgi:hypothetical protein
VVVIEPYQQAPWSFFRLLVHKPPEKRLRGGTDEDAESGSEGRRGVGDGSRVSDECV